MKKSEQELKQNLKILDEFLYNLISERRRDPDVANKSDLLSRLI